MTPDIAQAVMQDTEERFVHPEIARRSAAGEEFRGRAFAVGCILSRSILRTDDTGHLRSLRFI